jgi:aspartokinase/homoserine dehydrogenase 1
MRIEVHKFGGTSVLGADRMRNVAALIAKASENARVVCVASAMSGVTNELVATTAAAKDGRAELALAGISKIRDMHDRALAEIEGPTGPVRAEIERILDDLANVIRGSLLVGEVTPRMRDRIVATGEKLSVRLIALILRQMGHRAIALDADTFVDTDANYSDANPLPFVTDRGIVATLRPRLEAGEILVVTGFMGRAPDGSTTTFSRGGSDYTATLLAGALDADECTIWTDVDGVFTTDPRAVASAQLVPQLNYREAGELSYYGAKVLHQRTMIPVAAKRIPVRVRNTLNPSAPGTVVDGRTAPGAHPVKAVTAIKDQTLISLEGKGMSGVPGVSARLFGALAARSISVTMISQSSSESSVCLAVPKGDAPDAESALKREFRADLARGDIEDISVRAGVALVAAVGLGMAHTPGVAGEVFSALGSEGVNILAIAQGSSELNITLAIDQSQVNHAIAAIHDRFALDTPDAAVRVRDNIDLVILGAGKVSRHLIDLIRQRNARGDVHERFRIVAIADRSAFLHRPGGLTPVELAAIEAAKSTGKPLTGVSGSHKCGALMRVLDAAIAHPLARPVLIDASDAPDTGAVMLAAIHRRFNIVTANKRPLAGPFAQFQSLVQAARDSGREVRGRSTVGAGLPVVDTLRMLVETGDTIERIEGCFSGTLGFLMTALEHGQAFSRAVEEAVRSGYTEPDPVVDLSGGDVARKALILARFAGLVQSDRPVSLTGLVPQEWAGGTLPELLARLRTLDAPMEARAAEARSCDGALRFVARVRHDSISVAPEIVPGDSPLAGLRGTDNMIVFHSARYRQRPLVIAGPGAGVEVTAMGILADLLMLKGGRA